MTLGLGQYCLHRVYAPCSPCMAAWCQDLKLKPWRLALAQLSAPEGPVELDSERLRVRPSCGCSELDLTEVPDFCTENQTQAGRGPEGRGRSEPERIELCRNLQALHEMPEHLLSMQRW